MHTTDRKTMSKIESTIVLTSAHAIAELARRKAGKGTTKASLKAYNAARGPAYHLGKVELLALAGSDVVAEAEAVIATPKVTAKSFAKAEAAKIAKVQARKAATALRVQARLLATEHYKATGVSLTTDQAYALTGAVRFFA
jgi:hypothetical protein